MQDRYVGDIGDFGKYALLKHLAGDDLRLGVQWYLNPRAENNRDGEFKVYSSLRHCDPSLHDALNQIVKEDRRCVAAVEGAGILPRPTLFYSAPLCYRDLRDRASRVSRRSVWNAGALDVLAGADIVFMDADNGLAGRSTHPGAANGAKYVFADELRPYLSRHQSLIVYHHQTREKGGLEATIADKARILRALGCDRLFALVFRRQSVRIYFVLAAAAHVAVLDHRTKVLLSSEWGRGGHFELRVPKEL